jgi:hypothetical protein
VPNRFAEGGFEESIGVGGGRRGGAGESAFLRALSSSFASFRQRAHPGREGTGVLGFQLTYLTVPLSVCIYSERWTPSSGRLRCQAF